MQQVPVQKCPPAYAHGYESFDQHIFANRHQMPTSAVYCRQDDGTLAYTSTGISYDNYQRMSTHQRKPAGFRSNAVPQWCLQPERLRDVIVTAMVKRAFMNKYAVKMLEPLTPLERLRCAQAQLASHGRNQLVAQIGRLCEQYVSIKNLPPSAVRTELLRDYEIEIENCDTRLRMIERQAEFYCGVVYYYWHCGRPSPQVAAALKVKPPLVRVTLWRLQKTAAELGYQN
jgi:hypothetical protein